MADGLEAPACAVEAKLKAQMVEEMAVQLDVGMVAAVLATVTEEIPVATMGALEAKV